MSLQGSRAIVTGGSSGIGAAIVNALTDGGANVVVVDLKKPPLGEWIKADVSRPAEAFDQAHQMLGGLDIVVLNAGILSSISDPVEIDEQKYRRIISTNVDGVVFGIAEAARRMTTGDIVAIASLAGIYFMADDPIYSLTKHAVVGYVRAAASRLLPLKLNAVCPGIVDTTLLPRPQREALSKESFPLITPSEVAAAVTHILQTDGTGRAIVVQPGRGPINYEFKGVPGPAKV